MAKFRKKKVVVKIVGGKNTFSEKPKPVYLLVQKEPGIVTIEKKDYYYHGYTFDRNHERSAGKAAAGAIIGGALTGGVGAIAGAALGGKKKDTSIAVLKLQAVESDEVFETQIECDKNTKINLDSLIMR